MASIQVRLVGSEKAIARLKAIVAASPQFLRESMSKSMNRVLRRATLNLTGRVLNVDTGRLRQSLQTSVSVDGTEGRIGTNVEYARIHEFGGTTRPHVIRPRSGKALSFGTGFGALAQTAALGRGQNSARAARTARIRRPQDFVAVRSVQHPGSVMPARPYLGPALADSLPEIRDIYRAGIARLVRQGAS